MGNPVASLELPQSIEEKVIFTGYLNRDLPGDRNWVAPVDIEKPFILVTAGGGGDGEDLVDRVISAYETDQHIPHRAIIVTGPFMAPAQRQAFYDRCAKIEQLEIINFDNHIELLMDKAEAIIAMGGYNTFCEILSFDKKALIMPRSVPRKEQLIRAQRATELGLVSMIDDDTARNPEKMADAIRRLPDQFKPSAYTMDGLLDGHACIARVIKDYLDA